jgi:hypothetical protein
LLGIYDNNHRYLVSVGACRGTPRVAYYFRGNSKVFSYACIHEIRVHPSPSATLGCKSVFPKSYRTTSMTLNCFTDLFTRFVTVSITSTSSYRCNCHNPDGSLASRPLMTPHISGNTGTISAPLGRKTEPTQAKQLYIQPTGSCTVTNRYTSEAQSPAPGTNHFEIGWDILEGRERPWGLVLGLSFCVWLFFCFSIFVFTCSRLSLCLFFGFITSCSHSLFY